MIGRRIIVASLGAVTLALAGGLALAAGQYSPGATDSEIKIGNTDAYSGPASAYGAIGKAEAAFFAMLNEQGGINGRKINFITRDDGYSPPKTVELVRRLVEEDQVLLMFNTLGTPPNTAIQALSERQQGAAAVRRHRRRQVERPKKLSVDHGLAAELPHRGAHLRQVTFSRTCRTRKSRCSIRMTISARTI